MAPIVRAGALVDDAPRECRLRLGLEPERPTLLITGGSQGAGSINALIRALLRDSPEVFRGWQVIHQSGGGGGGGGGDAEAEGEALRAYQTAGVPALVRPFFSEMGLVWRASNLALTRCGAGAVAEAWANRVPALFLPYPYHRDEHQRWNALPLVDIGGALLERDLIDPSLNARAAGTTLASLLRDLPRVRAMSQALERLGPADGADRAARSILGL
ncbi:MAG: hypothetical protein CVV40_00645 [Planctomycetes bacterium HGW-Planctomycetes-2]|nr:MAG: hypothetical protein CVV40_00645 [Planctomycetes bacterium HGW-Planctomycetes-2]